MSELARRNAALPARPHQRDMAEDDSVVLSAVRAFLMDDDADCALDSDDDNASPFFPVMDSSSSSTESSESPTSPAPAPDRAAVKYQYPPARPRTINRSRARLQNEIFSLQQKAIALEQRLAEIRGGNPAAALTATANAAPETSTALTTPWKHEAQEQRELVEAAEQEREKLREKVTTYRVAIKRVRQFLRRQIERQPVTAGLIPFDVRRQTILHRDAPTGYQDLENNLQIMYTQLGSLFQDVELDSVTRVTDELHKFRIQNEDSLQMSIDFVKSRVLPFDVATTAKAVWFYHTMRAAGPDVKPREESPDRENVLRRSYVATFSFPHYKGHAHGRYEARRFVDKDRVVIIHSSVFHRLERTDGVDAFDGFGVRLFNWTVISPPRRDHLRTPEGRAVSHIDMFETIVPFFPDGNSLRSLSAKDRADLKTFCVKSVECSHAYERQSVENILLSGSM